MSRRAWFFAFLLGVPFWIAVALIIWIATAPRR